MRTLLLALTAGLVLSACATTAPAPTPLAEATTPAPVKDYFKIGARIFPRCSVYTSLGSRTDQYIDCLTPEQVALLESEDQSTSADIGQRVSLNPINSR